MWKKIPDSNNDSSGGTAATHKPWDDLTLRQKAEMMKVAVSHGLTSLADIKAKYNELMVDGNLYARGGRAGRRGGSANRGYNAAVQRAMNYFMGKGLTQYQAAGLVGNLMRESSLQIGAVNPKSGAYGLAQWLGDRKKKLFAMYGPNPTLDQQLDYAWYELNTTHRNGLRHLKNSKDAAEAARNAFGYYEFSAGPEGAVAAMNKTGQNGTAALNRGIQFASNIMGIPYTPYEEPKLEQEADLQLDLSNVPFEPWNPYEGLPLQSGISEEEKARRAAEDAFFANIQAAMERQQAEADKRDRLNFLGNLINYASNAGQGGSSTEGIENMAFDPFAPLTYSIKKAKGGRLYDGTTEPTQQMLIGKSPYYYKRRGQGEFIPEMVVTPKGNYPAAPLGYKEGRELKDNQYRTMPTNAEADNYADNYAEVTANLSPFFANLLTGGMASQLQEGAEQLADGEYWKGAMNLAAPVAFFGEGPLANLTRMAYGTTKLSEEDGVMKTLGYLNDGNYGRAALSTAGDLMNAGLAVYGGLGTYAEVEPFAKELYDSGALWDKYTTFRGRFGNYGVNLATNIYGTLARNYGLPDKARIPADVIRKIREEAMSSDGLVDLTGTKNYLGKPHINATYDRPVVSHKWGWDGADTYTMPTESFIDQTGEALKSIEPSDIFSNGVRVQELPQNVTLISGDIEALNKAREAGMQTLSSPRLRRLYQNAYSKYEQLGAFGKHPKKEEHWLDYATEVQRLQSRRGTPTLADIRLLEHKTGLNAGVTPIFEYYNALQQIEAMKNASIQDIMDGNILQYVYTNGRVVEWSNVEKELNLLKRAGYNKIFYDPASYIESNWKSINGVE